MSGRTHLAVLLLAVVALWQPPFGLSRPAEAQATTPKVTLARSELHHLHSEINGRDYELMVALPHKYSEDGDVHYPVIYVLDARLALALTAHAHLLMQIGGELPSLILIGVDGPGETLGEYFANRALDLTPTRNVEDEKEDAGEDGSEVRSGGADDFLRVLVEEVIPWAEARYPTGPERGLAGVSYGGLFATHALLQKPRAFTHYLIGSPSLWWDDGVMFEREKAYSADNKELAARVFMSAGTLEGEMILPDMLRMAEILTAREYADLEITSHIFEGETHLSVGPATVSRGMRFLFGAGD